MDECGETEVGEVGCSGEEELDHHIIGAMGRGAIEVEVGGSGDENTQKEEEGPGDYCMSSIGLVNVYLLEIGPETLTLIINAREVVARQQWLNAATTS
ncbi:hypothetical protein B296_00025166 [Ensete ventricosum]|uniref:Uncharacterized protein n=1 Tax=Ensete ventricosum TaxID=4639 RepID=A0A427AKI8_ENSVE|nr:hypothetical protein B296_00025166 [Ensete ventricosum]